jgi:hypothetical protein
MDPEQLKARLLDVSITLAAIRKGKKRGMANPRVYHKVKLEKKMIIQIQAERLKSIVYLDPTAKTVAVTKPERKRHHRRER